MSSSERGRALLGLGSVLAVALGTVWLGTSGHLDLYINPRYSVFTLVLALVGVVASVAGLVAVARPRGHEHEHEHEPRRGSSGRVLARRSATTVGAVVSVAIVVAMLVLPPTTLSARTAEQRSVDTGSLTTATGASDSVALLGNGSLDTSHFGVKDWAAVIRETTDTSSLVGKRVTLTGFVVPSAGSGSFTVTRFVISCCAVDAQPVGVGVTTDASVPDADRWVRVTGALAANPDTASSARLVLRAASVTPVARPSDPYEY
ncbi:TIGR03943 family putative permease subunit [Curtobacterium sp. Leaf261]|uniref:TIGR03943 family putative permease subunit n=1 Tax=Curtobacterium sp. Leaf261 TaxID=1736311 RepID=UPI0006F78304|nr:TIGR03943 family protein [Curtobacterium sp. Leaf261]KQO60016.1 hypothetical protein ASF23_15315 [Curtobacterium sp. Leaf261]